MPVIKAQSAPPCTVFTVADIEREAAALLEAARRRAGMILQQAREQAAAERAGVLAQARGEGHAHGRAEGLAAGLEEGRQQVRQEHSAKLEEVAAILEQALAQFDAEREALARGAAGEVTRLAVAIAGRVCKQAALLDPRICEENVAAALRLVVRANDVRLHIHPRNFAHIQELLPTIGRRWPALAHVTLAEDSTVHPGGCRVQTEGGLVDADLQTQLDRLAAELVPERMKDEG